MEGEEEKENKVKKEVSKAEDEEYRVGVMGKMVNNLNLDSKEMAIRVIEELGKIYEKNN